MYKLGIFAVFLFPFHGIQALRLELFSLGSLVYCVAYVIIIAMLHNDVLKEHEEDMRKLDERMGL